MSEKRLQIPLKEKQKYVTLIKQGTNLDGINYHYRKKYGTDLPQSTFYKWKAESSMILDSNSKLKFIRRKYRRLCNFELSKIVKFEKKNWKKAFWKKT
jgi:hypothetical protein